MKFDPQSRQRASARRKGYDYSLAGAYFITRVAYQRPSRPPDTLPKYDSQILYANEELRSRIWGGKGGAI